MQQRHDKLIQGIPFPDSSRGGRQERRRYPTGFPVRCTDAEKHEIFARAERANRSASRFLVELAVGDDDTGIDARPSGEELEILEGLMVQLRRLASNLHELASREFEDPDALSDAPSPSEIDEVVLEVRAVDYIQFDTNRVGGISQARKIAALAESHSVPVIPHAGQMHNYHVVMASLNSPMAEYFPPVDVEVGNELFWYLCKGEPEARDGFVDLDENTPGLGLTIDEDALKNFAVVE